MAASTTPPTTEQRRWWLLVSLCVVAAIAYLQRQVPGTVAKAIQTDLALNKEAMGTVLGAFFFSYAALQIPAGWLCSAWGVRQSLIAMVSLWAVASLMAARAHTPETLLASRLLLGAAQAGLFTSTTLAIRDRFRPEEYGRANGLLATGMQVGGLLGTSLAGELAMEWGWRWVVAACALPGIPWIAAFLLIDPPRRRQPITWQLKSSQQQPHGSPTAPAAMTSSTHEPVSAPAEAQTLNSQLAHVLRMTWVLIGSWSLWCLCTQQFFRAAAQAFYATWFSTYLQEARELDLSRAGWYTAGPIAAAAIGPFLGGWLTDWLTQQTGRPWLARHAVASLMLLGCAGLMAIGHLISATPLSVAVIAIGNLLSAAAGPAAYSASIHMGGRWLAVVFSIMNMLGNLGAALFPKAVAWFLPTAALQGASTLADWNRVFLVIAFTYVVAAVSWLMFDSNRCLTDK
jgi:ACS family D-galactonate transporter-like MFS transporter